MSLTEIVQQGWLQRIRQGLTESISALALAGAIALSSCGEVPLDDYHPNHPPVLQEISDYTINEGEELSFIVSAADSDGDELTYAAVNLPEGANFNPSTQIFSWMPNYRQSGVYSGIHFEVSDGRLSDSEDVSITVRNVEVEFPFTEAGAELGVDYQGDKSNGVAWGDYDNDGDLDLYVTKDGSANLLYRNDGTTFTEVGAELGVDDPGPGMGVAWGDYDNDGDLDLYVTNVESANRLYRNDGSTFTEVGAELGVDDSGAGMGVAWGDYDNDGDLDLFVVRYYGEANLLYRNDGTTFTEVGAELGVDDTGNGTGVAWADYDNDGDLDLYVTNHFGPNRFYRNDGGTFTEVGASLGINSRKGTGIAWGDYDNDGDLDLFVGNSDNSRNFLYRNDGSTFTEVGASLGINDYSRGIGAVFFDYDNDGNLDLYVVSAIGANLLYRNDSGRFTEVGAELGINDSNYGAGVAVGDYDNDGDLDLYISNHLGPNRFYRNETGHWNNHLIIKTVGTASNRDGIGARVEVEALIPEQNPNQPITQTREVDGSCRYHSFDSLPVEYGLGTATNVDRVAIYWPSGIEQTLLNCRVNQFLHVTEADETRECE